MDEFNELGYLQNVIGVSDEEVAARAKWSTRTFQKAKRNQVPEETKQSFFSALEDLRRSKIDQLTSLKLKTSS